MNKPVALSVILIIIVMIVGCTTQQELTYLSNLDTTLTTQYFPIERPDYRIQYQDILYVNISTLNTDMNALLNPELQRLSSSTYQFESNIFVYGYTVNDSGNINIPVLGKIYVSGYTIDEISNSISERAKLFVKDATVNVKLLSFKFTVIGEVNSPGTFTNFNNQLTVLEAIGRAGDITDYGDRKKVLVVRPINEGTHTYRINLQDKNLLQSEGYFLLPNDVVIVEPLKSKPFRLNIPTISLIVSSTLSAVTTLILLMNFINNN